MFTGIVRHVGKVIATRPSPAGRRLTIDLGPLADGLKLGDSVAVCGACLTASAIAGASAEFDVIAETLSCTKIGQLRLGSKANLERALRLGDSLDGHLVQGHVDGLARVKSIRRGDQWVVEFTAPPEVTSLMAPKGSVAVDGVSLTLAATSDAGFSVALIPTTLSETTLPDLKVGDEVNIETDIIGKYVRRFLQQSAAPGPATSSGGLTMDKLRDAGFV